VRKKSESSRFFYSTDPARARQVLAPDPGEEGPAASGPVRVCRVKKGRAGKTVTVVAGLALNDVELKKLARHLRRSCGIGGTVKDSTIELQGDQVDTVTAELEKQGFSLKSAARS